MSRKRSPITIVIADGHPIFRDGLKRLIEDDGNLRVLGEAGDGDEAVQLTVQQKPDVLLLELAMPRKTGLDALRELADAGLPTRPILLTGEILQKELLEALRLGAHGVVLKESPTALLFKAIRSVMDGQYWFSRDTVANLMERLGARGGTNSLQQSDSPAAKLTQREREIVGLIVDGRSNKEIAAKLSVSVETVKHHLTHVFEKLEVSNRLELAAYANRHRLVKSAEA